MKRNADCSDTERKEVKQVRKLLRGQCGFTLIELFIVLAILAILAAIAVPAVAHMRGSGETTAGQAELQNVQAAVDAMMADQALSSLSNPVTTATNNMMKFPDWESDVLYGYVLYPDATTGYDNSDDDKFIRPATTKGTYTCSADGTVAQASSGY